MLARVGVETEQLAEQRVLALRRVAGGMDEVAAVAYSRPLRAIATVPPLWLTEPVRLISMIFRRVAGTAFAGCNRCRLNWSISVFRWLFVK